MLDDLIQALRSPFQAAAHRRPRASGGAHARRRLSDLVHSVGGSPQTEGESALVTLNAWLSRAGGTSAEDDAEVLKAKLAVHDEIPPHEPDERAAREDVDVLKAKLQDQPPVKPEKARSTSDKTLAAKLRTESHADKYRARAHRRPAPPIAGDERKPDAPSLLVIPSASTANADRPRPGEGNRCTIRYWRGYVKSRFYAADGAENVIAESRLFRSRDAHPAEANDIVAAHRELIAQLEDAGWVPAGNGDRWYELRFRRTAVPAGHPSPTARPDREEHHV